jgi:hypothetical protein
MVELGIIMDSLPFFRSPCCPVQVFNLLSGQGPIIFTNLVHYAAKWFPAQGKMFHLVIVGIDGGTTDIADQIGLRPGRELLGRPEPTVDIQVDAVLCGTGHSHMVPRI